jgi:ABC-2 type transport system permease protein
MRYALAMAFREYRIRLTNPVLPLWDILVPVVYLIVFGASMESWIGEELVGELDYVSFFVGGVLGMVTFSVAMNSSYAFFEDLQSGMFHELMTYPFPRRNLLLGKLLFNALFSVVGAGFCVLAAAWILDVRISAGSLPSLLLWIVLGTAGWHFFFSWLSLKMRGFNAYHTTTSAAYLLLMFFSNLFYPLERTPEIVRSIALLNPITWQVDLLRHAGQGAGTFGGSVAIEAAAFVLFVVVSYGLANRKLNGEIE